MKAAIVGYGRIGRVHAAALRGERSIGTFVVCDPLLATADGAAPTVGGRPVYGDVDEMLSRVRPDVVHVCTPPATHASVAMRALRAGARVLVEKPMALTTDEVARLGALVQADPGALCVDHNFLFEPEVLLARRWVGEGRVGRVVAVDAFYGVDTLAGAAGPGAWAKELPGGRFTDLLPHPTYLAMHFLGRARGVSARWRGAGAGAEPTELAVVLECEHGLATIHVSLATVPWELGFRVRGTAGTIDVDLARQRAIIARPFRGPRALAAARAAWDGGAQRGVAAARRIAGKLSGRLGGYPGLRALIARFYASIRDGLPPPVPYADGAAVVAVVERVRLQLGARRDGARDLQAVERRLA